MALRTIIFALNSDQEFLVLQALSKIPETTTMPFARMAEGYFPPQSIHMKIKQFVLLQAEKMSKEIIEQDKIDKVMNEVQGK